MASFNLTSPHFFFIAHRETGELSLRSIRVFSTIFPGGKSTLRSVLLLTVLGTGWQGGRGACGTADWVFAFGFIPSHDSLLLTRQGVSFSSSFWDHCVWKETFK